MAEAEKRGRAASAEGGEESGPQYPCKKYFRSRAHCNPLSHNDAFDAPRHPGAVAWAEHYPGLTASQKVENLDVGCGFGGLAVALAQLAPAELTLALEIRPKVCEFVRRRIESLRAQHAGAYRNVSCLRTNSMIYLPNIIGKSQLNRLFFCFPDPHFKKKNHRRRVVSTALLAEYAFVLKPDGLLYCVTDVKDLHEWHVAKCEAHPCFQRIADAAPETDPFLKASLEETEEGKKVSRAQGDKFFCVFRRKRDEEMKPARLWTDAAASAQQAAGPGAR